MSGAIRRIVASQGQRPARMRREQRREDREPAIHRHLGEQVRVEHAVDRSRGGHLRERLLVGNRLPGSPERRRPPFQLGRRFEVQLEAGVVVEVATHAGDVGDDVQAQVPQLLGGTDAAAEQQLRRAVRAAGHHHEIGPHGVGDAPIHQVDADRATALHHDVGHRHPAAHLEFGPSTHRIEVGERGVPAHAFRAIGGLGAHRRHTVERFEVVEFGHPHVEPGIDERAMERGDLVVAEPANPHPQGRLAEQGQEVLGAPAREAARGPAVVVEPVSPRDRAPVVGGAAPDHPGAFVRAGRGRGVRRPSGTPSRGSWGSWRHRAGRWAIPACRTSHSRDRLRAPARAGPPPPGGRRRPSRRCRRPPRSRRSPPPWRWSLGAPRPRSIQAPSRGRNERA